MRAHPHSDISTAPRRAARRLTRGEPTSNLVKAIENLRNKMQTELHNTQKEANRVPKRLSRDSSHSYLHDSIMSTISAIEIKLQLGAFEVPKTQKAKVENSFRMLQVRDISSTPQNQSNLFNIKHMLILLNAKLANKKKFYNSTAGKGFEDIENKKPFQDVSQVMKSYSKMEVAVTEPDIKPTLFGSIAGRRKFLIPPNFASVTGSRVILTQLNSSYAKERSDINVKVVSRKNMVVHTLLTQLRERFNDLFTWSYILSNEPPEYYKLYAKNLIEKRVMSKPFHQRVLPAPAVTIPPRPPKRLQLKKMESDGIDAMEVDDMSIIDLEPKFHHSDIFKENSSNL